jgi:biotin carboxyl carrier protein
MKKFRVEVDGEEYIVNVEEIGSEDTSHKNTAVVTKNRTASNKPAAQAKAVETDVEESEMAPPPDTGEGDVLAPMPGSILEINVKKGEAVEKGDTLIVLEAMKMENEITAAQSGTVKEIRARVGKSVDAEDVLMVIE